MGVPSDTNAPTLQTEGNNIFKFWATGHHWIAYALAILELNRRDDFVQMAFLNLVWPVKDKMTLELPLKNINHPIVFAIVRRAQAKTIRSTYADLKAFTRQFTSDLLPPAFVILGENEEVGSYILDKNV